MPLLLLSMFYKWIPSSKGGTPFPEIQTIHPKHMCLLIMGKIYSNVFWIEIWGNLIKQVSQGVLDTREMDQAKQAPGYGHFSCI